MFVCKYFLEVLHEVIEHILRIVVPHVTQSGTNVEFSSYLIHERMIEFGEEEESRLLYRKIMKMEGKLEFCIFEEAISNEDDAIPN
jgi:hypothetical protein